MCGPWNFYQADGYFGGASEETLFRNWSRGNVTASLKRFSRNYNYLANLIGVVGQSYYNDYSERSFQLERGGQWVKGKSCDTFAPLGPFMATADEIPDPQALPLWLKVNGITRQNSTTAQMVFTVRQLISYLSQFMTLLPGDVISTGTPPGVGLGFKPPIFMKPGDVVELGIEGLGESKQTAVAWSR